MKRWTAGLACALLSGCLTYPATIAPASTPITPGKYTIIGPAEGSAFGLSILGMIPVMGFRQAGEAVDDALRRSGGDALINIAADVQILHLLIVTLHWTSLEATAVKLDHQ
jgi:hypothetical protein